MRKLGERATTIFAMLVDGLGVGDAKKLHNAPAAFMAVTVDYLIGASTNRPWAVYAIAHRYLANGDLVPDPDVEFYVVDDPGQPGAKAVIRSPSTTGHSGITATSTWTTPAS